MMTRQIEYILQLLSHIYVRPKMYIDNYRVKQIYSLILGQETELYPTDYSVIHTFHYTFSLWLHKKGFYKNTFDSFYWYNAFDFSDGVESFKQATALFKEEFLSIKSESIDESLIKMVDSVICRKRNFAMEDFLHSLENDGDKYILNLTVQEINNMISGKTAECKNNRIDHKELDTNFRFFYFSYVKEYANENDLYHNNYNYFTLTEMYKLFEVNYKKIV